MIDPDPVPRSPKTSSGAPARTPRVKKAAAAAATKSAKVSRSPAPRSEDAGDEDEKDPAAEGEEGEGADSERGDVEPAAGEGTAMADEDAFAEPEVDVDVADVPASRDLARGVGHSMERLDPMAAYLREIQRHPLFSPEETHALVAKFLTTQDPAVAARLVTANLRLVVKIAHEYKRTYQNLLDLVQEGNVGLIQAVKKFDPYRGVKLSTYSGW